MIMGKTLEKFRTSSHSLNIEKVRHNDINRSKRFCIMYNHIDIEDEFHIILKMSILSGIKKEIY